MEQLIINTINTIDESAENEGREGKPEIGDIKILLFSTFLRIPEVLSFELRNSTPHRLVSIYY